MNSKALFLTILSLPMVVAPECALNNETESLLPTKIISKPSKSMNQTYTKNNLTVHVKTIKKSELEKTLGFTKAFVHNVSLNTSITPIYITIKNNSAEQCFIEPKDIKASMLSYQELIDFSKNESQTQKIIKFSSLAGSGLLTGLWLWKTSILPVFSGIVGPIIAVGLVGFLFGAYYGLCYLAGKLIIPFFQNINIQKTIKKNTLQKRIAINPGKEFSTCIFLQKSEIIPTISIHSKNKNRQATTFQLDLSEAATISSTKLI